MNKRFIVRKYVMAESVADAVRKESRYPVDDCFIDDDWKMANEIKWKEIGFNNGKKRRRKH